MRCLSEQEIRQWMAQRLPPGTPLDATGVPDLHAIGYEAASCSFPGDSGQKVCLARLAAVFFASETNVLVCVRNWMVFPSSGHPPLLLRLRQALGEHRPLEDCPGHLFSAQEADDALSVIILALEFFWDCSVLGESGRVALFVSHDEYVEFFSTDRSLTARFKNAVGTASK